MKFFTLGKTLNGRDLTAIQGHSKSQAGNDAGASGKYGAGAALAMVASFFRAGKMQALTQQIEQGNPRLKRKVVPLAVNG